MTAPKFPKMLNYTALKQQFSEEENLVLSPPSETHLNFSAEKQTKTQEGLTGTRLRSYAFATLTRKEYSKADLIEKLCLYAANRDEVIELVDELAQENYQSDQRVAEMTVRSQVRQGKGPNRIKMALRHKQLDKDLVTEDLTEIDWYEQAYQLKVKKYGTEVAQDAKIKAKQIRFLQYRGFEMDAIMKAIRRKASED
ncbi:regulatory protein RecX [Acinetobacter sp. R933-2]|uniref:regulatory protein RecX n=1 Tax=Acinetobacter sp. R933-2 TaxID=2746728 RepID=UPI002574D51A|nr:regulatory protein RecX [Acinetobacter sp. R933-2]MDM1247540.1 regulatory protein RecX [Acinetobacter sp. R933-2]